MSLFLMNLHFYLSRNKRYSYVLFKRQRFGFLFINLSPNMKFKNTIGIVDASVLFIYMNKSILNIKTDDLLKVCFRERRVYFLNFICSIFSLLSFYAFFFSQILLQDKIISIAVFCATLIGTFKFKHTECFIMIARSDLSFVEIKVKREQKTQTIALVEKLNNLILQHKAATVDKQIKNTKATLLWHQ